jgi:hypothetical protein
MPVPTSVSRSLSLTQYRYCIFTKCYAVFKFKVKIHIYKVNAHLEQVDVCLLLKVCGQIQHGSQERQQAIAHCAQA